jgi:predicted RNA binding protein YcfA (HicA-like mRNA interferase family)
VTRLPVASARDAIKAFGRVGYEVDHQTGSHVVLRQSKAPHRRLTVPKHSEIAKGTLRALIREAGMTVEAFAALLD